MLKGGSHTPGASAAIAGWIALAACLTLAAPAAADTFKPTRFDDPEPGKCKANNCSLREAMKAADDHPGHDNVVVRPGRYELELPGMGLYEGSLDLVQGATIRARGRRNPTIDVNGLDQVITAWANGTSGESFEIRGLTLTGGVASPVTVNRGGAISTSSEDTFALDGVTIKGNSASQGGGVANHSSTLTITDSKIRDNEAGQGGGIYLALSGSNSPSVVIRNSLLEGNEASFGGGIYSLSPELTLQRSTIEGNAADEGGGLDLVAGPTEQPMTAIRASTISGNTARKGGGILADGNQPSPGQQKPVASLLNSTVALNHTSAEGGGIMADNAATVTLDQATIAYNTADDDNVNGGVAGGVYQHSGAIFSLADSIVAKNTVGSSGTAAQCEGTFAATAGGVVESQPNGTCTVPGSNVVADALIDTLADNGGPTETVKLLAGSPAIGFAHEGCPKKDQRGVKRPAEECDSGAFERKKP